MVWYVSKQPMKRIMNRGARTKGYYLPDHLIEWLEKKSREQSRSTSNFLALILEKEKADAP